MTYNLQSAIESALCRSGAEWDIQETKTWRIGSTCTSCDDDWCDNFRCFTDSFYSWIAMTSANQHHQSWRVPGITASLLIPKKKIKNYYYSKWFQHEHVIAMTSATKWRWRLRWRRCWQWLRQSDYNTWCGRWILQMQVTIRNPWQMVS